MNRGIESETCQNRIWQYFGPLELFSESMSILVCSAIIIFFANFRNYVR